MSRKINDGGQAFPTAAAYGTYSSTGAVQGMTLRDYFATKATDTDVEAARLAGEDPADPNVRCRARFRYADAMLAARAAGEG